jgi:hypothetical protein
VSAARLDALLSPDQEVLGEIAAEELRRLRHAVNTKRGAARTDAVPPKIDVERLDEEPNTPNRRNDMHNRNDANENLDASHEEAMRLDNSPDDQTDPIVRARAERDRNAASAWRVDADEEQVGPRRARRDAIRQRVGDPRVTKREIDEVIRARGGDPDLDGMSGDGLRQLIADARKRIAAADALGGVSKSPPNANMDGNDDDAIERARAARDADAANAWKAGTR